MSNIALQIDSITKSYVRNTINHRGENEFEKNYVINDLSLSIPKGEITALIGGNGTGKTTLFNIISGFLNADSGSVSFQNGKKQSEILGLPPHKITQLGIGRLFQDDHLFQDMTVMENMLIADENPFAELPFVSFLFQKKTKENERQKKDKAKEVFEQLFGADNPFLVNRDNAAKTLSYGQQKLLVLARLFMGNYSLVLLDEPTSGVNPKIIQKIGEIIKQMVEEKGKSVFLIEHNMKFVSDFADFCSFISDGKVAAFGTPEDVLNNNDVQKTYLGA